MSNLRAASSGPFVAGSTVGRVLGGQYIAGEVANGTLSNSEAREIQANMATQASAHTFRPSVDCKFADNMVLTAEFLLDVDGWDDSLLSVDLQMSADGGANWNSVRTGAIDLTPQPGVGVNPGMYTRNVHMVAQIQAGELGSWTLGDETGTVLGRVVIGGAQSHNIAVCAVKQSVPGVTAVNLERWDSGFGEDESNVRRPPSGPVDGSGSSNGAVVRQALATTVIEEGDLKAAFSEVRTDMAAGVPSLRPSVEVFALERVNVIADLDIEFFEGWEGAAEYEISTQVELSLNGTDWEDVWLVRHTYPAAPLGSGEDPDPVPYIEHIHVEAVNIDPTGLDIWAAGRLSGQLLARVTMSQTTNGDVENQAAMVSANNFGGGTTSLIVQACKV